MTDPLSGAALSLGGTLARAGAKETTKEWRLARNVSATAKRRGAKVNQKQLKLALYQPGVFESLRSWEEPSPTIRSTLDSVLVEGIAGSSADFLLPLLREGVARQMSAVETQAFLYTEVAVPIAQISAQLQQRDDESLTLNPLLVEDARALAHSTGEAVINKVLQILSPPESRGEVLRDWLEFRPIWLIEDEALDAWIGEFAMDSDHPDLGREWLARAVEGSATPRAYLKVRMAASQPEHPNAYPALSDVRGNPVVEAVLTENDLDTRRQFLDEWAPSSEMQRAFKASLSAQQLLEARDLDGAIRMGGNTFDSHGYSGAGVVAAEALIQRSMMPGRGSSTSDLAAARHLALRVRDARRAVGVVAARAIRVAINASMLLVDFAGAKTLFTVAPQGVATAQEAAHPLVREAAIAALAQLGDIQEALDLVSHRTPRESVLQLQAREAEINGDDTRANKLWAEALDAVSDWSEKATLSFILATRGVLHPFVDQLRADNEDIALELAVIAALNGHAPGAEARAERLALDNRRVARALALYYSDADRDSDGLRLAEHMARRWSDPDEWLRAARFYLRGGAFIEAIDRARTAFSVGGDVWGDRASALRLQIAALQNLRRWEDVVSVGQVLLQIEPEAADAGWAVVFAHHYSADDEQAFYVWKSLPACHQPSTVGEASLWLHLYRQFGTEMAPLSHALRLRKQFPQEEQVRRLVVGAVLLAPIARSDVSIQVMELADEYHADFPEEDQLLWTIAFDSEDPEEILSALDRAAGGRSDLTGIEQRVANGTFPVGLLAKWCRRDYADVLVRRRFAPRFAGTGEDHVLNLDALNQAAADGTALDTSAALTIATLPEELRERVARLPRRLLVTYGQLRDVHTAAAQAKKSRGEYFPSTDHRGPLLHRLSPEEELDQERLFAEIEARFRLAERSDSPAPSSSAPELGDILGPWTEAISRAAEAKVPLWCDDAATRAVATLYDVASFGTPELIEWARATGVIDAEEADAIDGALIHAHLVGVRYRKTPWELALVLDGYRPAGLAQALTFGGSTHLAEKLDLVFESLRMVLDDPEALAGWGGVAAGYLSDMTTDAEQAISNIALFLRALLAAAWMAPHQLAFAARGARETSADRWYPALREAFRAHWRALRSIVDVETGAGYMIGQVGALSSDERQLALEIILRDDIRTETV